MKFPILASYAYVAKPAQRVFFDYWLKHPAIDVLLDSGAFTAHNSGREVSLDEYCGFLDLNSDHIFRYIALDVIGDPVKSEENLKAMLKAGYKPAPVHVLGDDQRRMDELFEMSDFVCLGGLLRPGRGHAAKPYLKAKMDWAAGRPVHWLGFVRVDLFRSFRPESCDSSSWTGCERFGRIMVYLGAGRWLRCTHKERATLFASRVAMQHVKKVGYTARHLDDPGMWRNTCDPPKNAAKNITADSWVRYVIDLYRRFGVRVFMVISLDQPCIYSVGGAIDRHAAEIAAAQPPEVLCSPSSA